MMHHSHDMKKEHVQLRFVYKNRAYFENSGSNWSKLGSFVDKHHILYVISFNFWIKWRKGYVTVICHFCLCHYFRALKINLNYQKA